eukprot:2217904-Alexandrium_andersonii.AAC.1
MRPAATDAVHGGARAGIRAAWRSLLRRVKLGAIGSVLLGSPVAILTLASLGVADVSPDSPVSRRAVLATLGL